MCVACHPSEVAVIAGGTFAGIIHIIQNDTGYFTVYHIHTLKLTSKKAYM